MAAGLRALYAAADMIDVFVEVRDARVPHSTGVAAGHAKISAKPSYVLLNRADLADPHETQRWVERLATEGTTAFAGTAKSPRSLAALRSAILCGIARRSRVRVAVVGAPNTGKSSVLNALAREKRAFVQDRPGATRRIEWRRLGSHADILDTPGLLPPRIVSAQAAWQLALCGVLPEQAYEPEDVVEGFRSWAAACSPRLAPTLDLDAFAALRGKLKRGGELDRAVAARLLIAAFRSGALGRVTFELSTMKKT